MPLLAGLLLLCVLPLLLTPLSLLLRYRAGTARRQARGWVALLNLLALVFSLGLFLLTALVTSHWVPLAFTQALAGLAAGAVCGLLGLALSRWEPRPEGLYYTPPRTLVLLVTLVVAGRIAYGLGRGVYVWWAETGASWVVAFGPGLSLAAAGLVLGYYLSYASGLYWRLRRHRARLVS